MWSDHNLISGDETESTTAGRSARIDRSVDVRDGEASGSKPKFDCIRRIGTDPGLTDRNSVEVVVCNDVRQSGRLPRRLSSVENSEPKRVMRSGVRLDASEDV